MFFRRASKAETQPAPAEPAAGRTGDEKAPGFKTTADLEPATGPIGQERALEALAFGLAMKGAGFNILVAGPPACGKRRAVRDRLAAIAAGARAPSDWVYVANFEDPRRPRALRLPTGRAQAFARAMTAAITELRASLPAAFAAEDTQARRAAIDEELRFAREDALDDLIRTAAGQNVAVRRTPAGYAMAPMLEGRVVKAEVFDQLPEPMRREVEARIGVLEKRLEIILAEAPKSEKERRRRLAALDEEVAAVAVAAALEEVTASFGAIPEAAAYLKAAAQDLVRNAALFLAAARADGGALASPAATARDPRFRRYMVDVVATNEGDGAPVVEEASPSLASLLGRIERMAASEALFVRPGALHKANGGALVIDARRLLQSPPAWEALKRALATRSLRIEPAGETAAAVAEETLEPQPIPLDLKVVLIADPSTCTQLRADPELGDLFKVEALFCDRVTRTAETEAAYARLVAGMVAEHALKPVDATGVARLIEEAGKLAGAPDMLTLEIGRIGDLVREADHWSSEAKRAVTGAEDVGRALSERARRAEGSPAAAATEAPAANVPLPFAKAAAKSADRPRLSKVAL